MTTMTRQQSCKEQIRQHLASRIEDIGKLWKLYIQDAEASDPELGHFNEYGLCFDYVAPGTFKNQHRGYFRYQLSWGGPSDEFRFYCDGTLTPTRIEYWFLDWFDGAHKLLTGREEALLREIFEDFKDCGAVQVEHDKAEKEL